MESSVLAEADGVRKFSEAFSAEHQVIFSD